MDMKRWGLLLIVIGIVLGFTTPSLSQTAVSMSIRYDTFHDDRSPESQGDEMTIPFGISYKSQRFLVSLESAYSSANIDWSDGQKGELASLTDTVLSTSYSYTFSDRPIALLFGLDMNLPTGKATLNKTERLAEAGDRNDLFEVDNFGEGFNIGPSIGILREFRNASLTVNGAYIFYGEYDPASDIPDDDLNPGDQLFLLGALNWYAASWLDIGTFLSYSYFTPDEIQSEERFQDGQRLVVSGNARLRGGKLGALFSAQYATQGKNKVLIDNTLREESKNSNGDEFFGLLMLSYIVTSDVTLRLQGDMRYYSESEYVDPDTDLPFLGKRVRFALGPGLHYRLNKHLSLNSLLKGFFMDQERDMFVDDDASYYGANLDVGFRYVF
ncbi:MAG: hypothetical protein GY801_21130 [bacterium]|nr:hypothetical protein [bacterium]